jgi:hypothetical protein
LKDSSRIKFNAGLRQGTNVEQANKLLAGVCAADNMSLLTINTEFQFTTPNHNHIMSLSTILFYAKHLLADALPDN